MADIIIRGEYKMLQVTEDSRRSLEVEGLIERWQQHRDERAFSKLLGMHRHIIVEEARRVRWPGSEYADRVAAGHEGFLMAVNSAKLGHGEARFDTFCRMKIKGRITNDRRDSIVGDPSRRQGEDEVSGSTVPVDDLANVIVDPAPSPERVAIARGEARAILKALDVLSDKQRRVIEALYSTGLTQAEAAEQLGLTERHVHRIAHAALDILRHEMTA